jgi:cyclophilin family peptidyl-prolyl cis-trans isomerase
MRPLDLCRLLAVLCAAPVVSTALAANPQVDVQTSLGHFRLELYPAAAPKTVANFLQYVRDGHYNGTIFHRVIAGFMIQGGGYDQAYHQRPTRAPIANEAELGIKSGLKNEPGTVAMARTADPNSATAQFFINVNDNSFLDWGDPRGDGHGYAVFGKVVQGMDVVTKIAQVPTGPGGPFGRDVPREPVVIESMTIAAGK